MISPGFFFIFLKCSFGKRQKRWQKKSVCFSWYLRNYISYNCYLWYLCKMMMSLRVIFFHFFKILIFWIFQSSWINAKRKFWGVLSHLLHMCVIFFHFFTILIFQVVSGAKRQKKPKMTKNYACCAPYCWNHTSYDCHLWCTSVKWWNLLGFHYFFKILIFGLLGGSKCKKWPKWQKTVHCALYLKNHTSYDHDFWYTCVEWWHLKILFSIFLNFDFAGC